MNSTTSVTTTWPTRRWGRGGFWFSSQQSWFWASFFLFHTFSNFIWSEGIRCCRSDWPGLCLFCCPSCDVSHQSWFGLFLCHKCPLFYPPPPPDVPCPSWRSRRARSCRHYCWWRFQISRSWRWGGGGLQNNIVDFGVFFLFQKIFHFYFFFLLLLLFHPPGSFTNTIRAESTVDGLVNKVGNGGAFAWNWPR